MFREQSFKRPTGLNLDTFMVSATEKGEKVVHETAQASTAPSVSKPSDAAVGEVCLLYTSPSPRDLSTSRMPSSA